MKNDLLKDNALESALTRFRGEIDSSAGARQESNEKHSHQKSYHAGS
jgi:hypothetical protein